MQTTFMEAISITLSSMAIVLATLALIALILGSFKHLFKPEVPKAKAAPVAKKVVEENNELRNELDKIITEIQNKELDYVLDWNEEHPDNQIQPEINYFRVYPSAIDENGKYWYYLHFFCRSGEGLDQELKSKY